MLHTSPHSLGDSLVSVPPPAEVALARLKHDEVELIPQQILLSEGMPIDYIYLIQRGLVSLLRSMENGATVEVGRVGRKGFAGAEIALGSNTSSLRRCRPDRWLGRENSGSDASRGTCSQPCPAELSA